MTEGDRAERLERRAERERQRREQAERIAEESTRELYEHQRDLKQLAGSLEERVEKRTRELEQRLEQQSRLAEISSLALEGAPVEELMEEACQAALETLDPDYCGVFELQQAKDQLVLRTGWGWPSGGVKTVPATPDCQTGKTLEQRSPVLVEDIREDARFEDPPLFQEERIRSGVTVLIRGSGRPWGIFGVHSRAPQAFDEDDTAFIESLSHVLSQALIRDQSRRDLEEYADRLKRANQELEEFAHLLSHDLREPVRMVNSYMELLLEEHGDELDEGAREMVEHARKGAKRSHDLVKALLKYSRLDTEGPDLEPVDADPVLDEVLESLAPLMDEADARIEREPLPTVIADRAQLGQVFQNLVSNAIKYSQPGARPLVRIDGERSDGVCRFSVEDNGMGMDPRETEDIFEMFHQGSSAEGGQGIGLAVCKKIINRHDGDIWVETEPGEGSTFHFTLPSVGDAESR